MRNRTCSQDTYDRLCQVIPGGVNSPVRACFEMEQTPLVVDYAIEDKLVDVDGHSYIDYCCSWGVLIHGHAHPQILKAVMARAAKGTTFGITTAIEEQLARKVVEIMGPSIEKIRFVSSGTEATMSAVRLARGYTKRDLLIKFSGNYHGHADFFLVQAGSGVLNLSSSSSAGIPNEIVKHTICLPYNDVEACQQVFQHPAYRDRIAAVIVEPIAGNMGVVPGSKEFLTCLREQTAQQGSLLIFDEVISGFRIGLRGAQEYYGIKPDLTCLGKIVGGGFPAAAFGGRKEIMDCLAPLGPVYQAGTLSGNPIAMEAGLQALRLLEQPYFYQELQRKTNLLIDPIVKYIKEYKKTACIQQAGSMFTLFFGKDKVQNLEEAKQIDAKAYARLFKFLFNKGIYIPPSAYEAWFVSAAHDDKHLVYTAETILEFLEQDK